MAVVGLEMAKKAIRVYHDDDDELIQAYIDAAEAYLNRIGVAVAAPASPDAQIAVLLLVGHLYQFREPVVDGNIKEVPLSLQIFISGLRGVQL